MPGARMHAPGGLSLHWHFDLQSWSFDAQVIGRWQMTAQSPRHGARALRFGAHVGRGVRRLAVDATLRGRRGFPAHDRRPDTREPCRDHGLPGHLGDGARRRVGNVEPGAAGADRRRCPGVGVHQDVRRQRGHPDARRSRRTGETEANFYRHLAPELAGSGVPRSYGADFDPLTGRYVVVLEGHDHLAVPVSGHTASVGQGPERQPIECFARLHGTFWGRPPDQPSGKRSGGGRSSG